VIDAEENEVGGTTTPEETTLAETLNPLLTSMKLFGMYFGCRTSVGDKSTSTATKTSRLQWNLYLIYGVVVVIIYWINALRMFSVFSRE